MTTKPPPSELPPYDRSDRDAMEAAEQHCRKAALVELLQAKLAEYFGSCSELTWQWHDRELTAKEIADYLYPED